MGAEFRLLGEVEATVDGREVDLGHARQRAVLAALLVDANQVVPADRLVDRVWGERVPETGRNALYSYLSRLRSALPESVGLGLRRRSGGYVAVVDPQLVDLHRFDRSLTAARASTDGAARLAALDTALGLWRDRPLAGLDGPWFEGVRARLERDRTAAELDRVDLLLGSGRHAEVLSAVVAAAERHPLDERVAGQLLLALYRNGRQADALEHYRLVRARLRDELGVDPGPELSELHQRILTAAPDLVPATPVVLAQLPAELGGFAGRHAVLAELDTLSVATGPVVVAAITGAAGVGKTALALHWAHRVRARFPDGQLYLNLRGTGSPLPPSHALARLLSDLGVAEVPTEVDAAAAAYRSALAGRRVLVVLDDAANAVQVRPLLPGSPGCLVLVTSRDRLDGLVAREGARRIGLDVLTPEDALVVLEQVVGSARIAAEPAAAADVVELCARLPLALRIAAANLVGRPGLRIADYAATLRTGDRLAELEVTGDAETAVRAAITLSYNGLPVRARRVFRLLGLMPGLDLTEPAVAALVGTEDVRPELRELTAAHLVAEHGPGRYTFHDLLRLYAAERAVAEDGPDGEAALDRLGAWYAATTDLAVEALDARRPVPPFESGDRALDWLAAEAPTLVAVVERAADRGVREHAWRLAVALRRYFPRGGAVHWEAVTRAGLRAAKEGGDAHAQTQLHNSLGALRWQQGEYSAAADHFQQALARSTAAGWATGRLVASSNLGILRYCTGPLSAAAENLVRAERIGAEEGIDVHRGTVLINLGATRMGQGRIGEAVAILDRARLAFGRGGPDRGLGMALECLADCHLHLGDLVTADQHVDRAVEHCTRHSFDHELAAALRMRAKAREIRGDLDEAAEVLAEARELADGHHLFELDVRNALGGVLRKLGRPEEAADLHDSALVDARRSGFAHGELEALLGLAAVHLSRGEAAAAATHALMARARAHETGYVLHHARALVASAAADLLTGHRQRSAELAERALDVQRRSGSRLDEADTLLTLGRAGNGVLRDEVEWHALIARLG
ncbi:BTAD domain-containing putative transcriptional regulator [Umezawaea sp. NPDC059074]|uniref:AfsR/SARP family transcriptional regulator n=1 Tax=Umezawaea sp. NPDC059074 TaxID=3346716 RepID=UPI0036B9476E